MDPKGLFGKMALTEGLVGPARAKGGNAEVLLPCPASPEHRTAVGFKVQDRAVLFLFGASGDRSYPIFLPGKIKL